MKEYLLSFDNTQRKRQKELLVEYRTYSIRKKYLFVYQRDGISLDVECFKDLVSFSKKPTRSSLLCLEWVYHSEPIRLQNNLIQMKSRKPFTFLPITNLTKLSMYKNITLFNKMSGANVIFDKYAAYFENFLIEPKDKINVNILKNLLLKYLKPYETKIFENNLYYKNYVLNEFENITLNHTHGKTFNVFENPIAEIDHTRFTTVFDYMFLHYEFYTNIFENFSLSINNKTFNIFERTYGANKSISPLFVNDTDMAKNTNVFHLNFFNETLFAMLPIPYLNTFENFNVFNMNTLNNINVLEIVPYEKNKNRYLNRFENDLVSLSFKNIATYRVDFASSSYSKNLNIFTDNALMNKTLSGPMYLYNEPIFGNNNISAYLQYYNDEERFLGKYVKHLFLSNNDINLDKKYQHLFVSDNNISVLKGLNNNLTVTTYTMISKQHRYMFIGEENKFLNKDYMSLDYYNGRNIWMQKYFFNLSIYDYSHFIRSISKDMNIYRSGQDIAKTRYPMFPENHSDFISRERVGIAIYDKNFYHTIKNNYRLALLDVGTNLSKYSKELHTLYSNTFINKFNKSIEYNIDPFDINKISASMFITINSIYMQKFVHNIFLTNNYASIFKEHKDSSLDTDYIHDIIKDYTPIMLNTNNDKVLIAINKLNKPLFTYDILTFVSKQRANVFDNTSTGTLFTDKNFKEMFDLDNLFCDKLAEDTTILDLINESVIKNQIQTWFVNEDIFINKYAHGTDITLTGEFIDKDARSIFLPDRIWVNKDAHNVTYFNQQDTFDKIKRVFEKDTWIPYTRFRLVNEFSQEWFVLLKYAFFHQEIPLYKQYKEMFRQNENIFMNEPVGELAMFPTSNSLHIDRFLYVSQTEQIARTSVFPAEFYEHLFLTRDMFLDMLPGFDELDRTIKEAGISTDTALDWAWTYHEEDPFDDPFKIDELLLPENDSRYEDFENIIFNKDTGKPRNPVQIIDDYTFIAKYPNHYPIKDENGENAYKNVAIEYLDVRTSIMKQVFLGYYQLWQDHIFEFSRMTIPQSAKKILDYLYAWIFVYFPEEDIPEALRTFRLVRWYLERGIIETSEYYITFTPKDLKSDMSTTQINIPCDLYPTDGSVPNNTMYVDTNLRVIRNDPNQLRHEAHLTIYIDNKKDTLVSFSLHTQTPVYIILNEKTDYEEVLDSITIPTTGKMVYNIPYKGIEEIPVNTLTIKKYNVDNNDNEFFIGNIIIQGLDTKNGELEISFNPGKIQGNKVLNHVSQKVMAYANLYMDNEEIINELIKGNIHLGEVYEHLLEYWDLHHQNKDKGKRLTIKRT